MSATAGTTRDRLAVWEWEEQGEVLAAGDWLVSDAERAAAGRETVAERFRRLLPANRDRAARQYADGGLPDGQDIVRVWFPRDAASLETRLDDRPFAVWAQDDVLHVLWRAEADQAALAGGIQLPLWPVDGQPGLWEASVRVRDLDEAMISIAMYAIRARDAQPVFPSGEPLVFRGPRAPAPAPDRALTGEVQQHVLPACVLADGQSVSSFAPELEATILAGTTPPTVLVGVHDASVRNPARPPKADLRALEYLPMLRSRRFAAHLSFVSDEVVPWAAGRFPVAPRPWIAAGYSNGAVWAITAAQRRPDLFSGVAALSAGMVPRRVARSSHQVRHYLAAGTLEPGFRRATSAWAARLERAGMTHAHREWAGGHDSLWWNSQLPAALTWLLERQ
jgi:hypothetical protein